MEGCLRVSSCIVVAAALVAGCSSKVLVVVDPDPCADGGCFPPELFDGLVGYWRLDETEGTTAKDSSEGRNPGRLVGLNPATAWVAGHAAGGLSVQAGGYVEVLPSASLDSITTQVTVSGWGYLQGTVMDYATIASREIGSTIDQHYHISINTDETPTLFIASDADMVRLTTPTPVTRSTWVHIAGTYDGTIARLYVNGQHVAAEPLAGPIKADTTPFILGGNGNGMSTPTELFPGRIDEVMLYRRALTPVEIAQLHDGALFQTR